MRTPGQAVAAAAAWAASQAVFGVGKCLGFVERCWGLSGGYDASSAYQATTQPGSGPAVYAAPVWWTGGEHGHGHIAIATGDGYCYSTDFGPDGYIGDGRVRKVLIASISTHDPLLTYQGWTYDLAGTTLIQEDWIDMATQAEVQAAFEAALANFFKTHWPQMVQTMVGVPNGYIGNPPTAPAQHLKSDS